MVYQDYQSVEYMAETQERLLLGLVGVVAFKGGLPVELLFARIKTRMGRRWNSLCFVRHGFGGLQMGRRRRRRRRNQLRTRRTSR